MTVLQSLLNFASKRPSLEFANYGNVRAYRADSRGITKDLHAVRALASVARYACTNEEILAAARSTRVTIEPFTDDNGAGWRVSYTAGQYYPVEYRAGVAIVLASAIWRAFAREIGDRPDVYAQIRRRARQELPLSVYRRFFS
jgi:hypothetical protein